MTKIRRPLQVICAVAFLAICGATTTANPADIPSVDGGVGSCRADFTVKDGAAKPIYNAQIEVLLRYGFMNMRKTDLQVGTDSDGKARFTGLPQLPEEAPRFPHQERHRLENDHRRHHDKLHRNLRRRPHRPLVPCNRRKWRMVFCKGTASAVPCKLQRAKGFSP